MPRIFLDKIMTKFSLKELAKYKSKNTGTQKAETTGTSSYKNETEKQKWRPQWKRGAEASSGELRSFDSLT